MCNNTAFGSALDLRAATLQHAAGGGGFLSYINGIDGGYTIAFGAVIENAFGGSGADKITGNTSANILRGNAGNDRISAGAGNDAINGGAGIDQITGGAGRDVMTGGASRDVFVFSRVTDSFTLIDRITDFADGLDDISLAAIDAIAATAGINDTFTFIGNTVFDLVAGKLRFQQNVPGNFTTVEAEVTGDGVADFVLRLDGLHFLTALDFIR